MHQLTELIFNISLVIITKKSFYLIMIKENLINKDLLLMEMVYLNKRLNNSRRFKKDLAFNIILILLMYLLLIRKLLNNIKTFKEKNQLKKQLN